jgi:hypothetical protein
MQVLCILMDSRIPLSMGAEESMSAMSRSFHWWNQPRPRKNSKSRGWRRVACLWKILVSSSLLATSSLPAAVCLPMENID